VTTPLLDPVVPLAWHPRDGTEKDGLFSGGTYYGGTRKATFDVSSALTVVNAN